jgi:hypothetical protein
MSFIDDFDDDFGLKLASYQTYATYDFLSTACAVSQDDFASASSSSEEEEDNEDLMEFLAFQFAKNNDDNVVTVSTTPSSTPAQHPTSSPPSASSSVPEIPTLDPTIFSNLPAEVSEPNPPN